RTPRSPVWKDQFGDTLDQRREVVRLQLLTEDLQNPKRTILRARLALQPRLTVGQLALSQLLTPIHRLHDDFRPPLPPFASDPTCQSALRTSSPRQFHQTPGAVGTQQSPGAG